jgi:hypothetical protein
MMKQLKEKQAADRLAAAPSTRERSQNATPMNANRQVTPMMDRKQSVL